MVYAHYPKSAFNTDKLNFTASFIAVPLIIIYFINEMILSIYRLNYHKVHIGEAEGAAYPTFRMIDAGIYAAVFIMLMFQMLRWMGELNRIEYRNVAKRAALALFVAAIFVIMFEYLQIAQPLSQTDQSDLTVPFILDFSAHAWAILSYKSIIEKIGRHYKVNTGTSIFYILFALVPIIKFGLPVFLLIFIGLIMSPGAFIFYSEITMSYIVAVIALGFGFYIIMDAKKILKAEKIEQIYDKIKKEEEKEKIKKDSSEKQEEKTGLN